jgi:hypothetical protein
MVQSAMLARRCYARCDECDNHWICSRTCGSNHPSVVVYAQHHMLSRWHCCWFGLRFVLLLLLLHVRCRQPGWKQGFFSKVMSLTTSSFSSALLLDADSMPLANPEGTKQCCQSHCQDRVNRCVLAGGRRQLVYTVAYTVPGTYVVD